METFSEYDVYKISKSIKTASFSEDKQCSRRQSDNPILSCRTWSENKVEFKAAAILFPLLLRKECQCGPPSTVPQCRQCQHKLPMASSTAHFSSIQKLVCLFISCLQQLQKQKTDNVPEHLFLVSNISYIMPTHTMLRKEKIKP